MSKERNKLLIALSVAAVFVVAGCAENIGADPGPDAGDTSTGPVSKVKTLEDADGGYMITTVDASSEDDWIYFQLATGSEGTPDGADWDLAFQRFKIKSNGGISGNGGVEVARMASATFDDVSIAPTMEYLVDAEDSDDTDVDPDYPFLGPTPWFDYNPMDHSLSPADVVYVIRSVDGDYYKFQMLGYYNEPGTSGYPQFRWASVDQPDGTAPPEPEPDDLVVDASAQGEWRYVNVTLGTTLEVAEPENSMDWDVAISRTQFRTNGGTSGAGYAGAIELPDTVWDDVTTSPTVGFDVDAMIPLPGPPGSGQFSGNAVLNGWYDYDSTTHQVSPKDTVFLVRTADGDYAKLRVLQYEDGVFTLETQPIMQQASVHTDVFDAAEPDSYAYFKFDVGEHVEPADPTTSTDWDLAVSGTKLQTNSGTSGPGDGGALDPAVTGLADIMIVPAGSGCYLPAQGHVCDCSMSEDECAAVPGAWTPQCACPSGFVLDEMLPVPGPPGSGDFSGNPVLAGWYTYDSDTHVVSPNDAVYVIQTANGAFVKLKITAYENGSITMDWVYAGPEKNNF